MLPVRTSRHNVWCRSCQPYSWRLRASESPQVSQSRSGLSKECPMYYSSIAGSRSRACTRRFHSARTNARTHARRAHPDRATRRSSHAHCTPHISYPYPILPSTARVAPHHPACACTAPVPSSSSYTSSRVRDPPRRARPPRPRYLPARLPSRLRARAYIRRKPSPCARSTSLLIQWIPTLLTQWVPDTSRWRRASPRAQARALDSLATGERYSYICFAVFSPPSVRDPKHRDGIRGAYHAIS